MSFNNVKRKVLQDNARYLYMLEKELTESSHVEKDQGVLVDKMIDMNQQCAPAAQVANGFLNSIGRGWPADEGGLCPSEALPGVLLPCLRVSSTGKMWSCQSMPRGGPQR